MSDWSPPSAEQLAALNRYRLKPGKSMAGRIRGERISPRKGVSIEFADYRHYVQGDDLRHLDWNILARHDRPVMKTYRDEQELLAHLYVDSSASMGFGAPSKLDHARSIAAALAYIALLGGDAVFLGSGPGIRGRAGYRKLAEMLSLLKAKGAGIEERPNQAPGLTFVLTDGLDPNMADFIRRLAGRGHQIAFVQILSDIDLDPDLEGDLRLIDSESSSAMEITATSGALKTYKENLSRHCDELSAVCRRTGATYIRLDAPEEPIRQAVIALRRAGLIA